MIENTIKSQNEIEIYTSEIYVIVDEFIQREIDVDPNILDNKGFFPRLIKHIYISYIKNLLNNGKIKNQNSYNDIVLLDNLFNIYVDLVYKYKHNKRPSIEEFCIFTGIAKQTIYDWNKGIKHSYIYNNSGHNNNINSGLNGNNINISYMDTTSKWLLACETALIDEEGVKSIFLLKAKYGYREEPTQVIVTNNQQILTASDLPQLENVSHFDIEPKQIPQNSEKLQENS